MQVVKLRRNDRPAAVVRRTVEAFEDGAEVVIWDGGRSTVATMSNAEHQLQVVDLSGVRLDAVERCRGARWTWRRDGSDSPPHVDALGVEPRAASLRRGDHDRIHE